MPPVVINASLHSRKGLVSGVTGESLKILNSNSGCERLIRAAVILSVLIIRNQSVGEQNQTENCIVFHEIHEE